tara:strand:+ start:186 stop:500 length:315 start_codon:yes stop_codon:yes gene_type:complete
MDDEKDIDDFRFFLIISEKPTHNRFLKKNAFVRSMGRRRRRRRDQNREEEEEEDEKQKEEEEESLCTRRLLFKCTTIQHTHTHISCDETRRRRRRRRRRLPSRD